MKKYLVYVVGLLILLLGACVQEEKTVIKDNKTVEQLPVEVVKIEKTEVPEEVQEPLYELDASWALRPIGDADSKVVLLTIDDAPDKRALDMAKTLKELDAPAIFFVNGHFLTKDKEKQVLKELYEMGFTIGNHTKTHADLKQLSEGEQHEEIISVSDAVEAIIGERPRFFRAPFGVNTDYSKALVKQENMLLMNWSYGYDWEKAYMESAALTDIMVNTELLGDGANLLMHDREWTADGLRGIVEGLRAKGYSFIDPATIQGVEQ